MNSNQPKTNLRMTSPQYRHARVLYALEHELESMRRNIRRFLKKRNLYQCTRESADLKDSTTIQHLSEKAVATMERLRKRAEDLIKEVSKSSLDPEAVEPKNRAQYNVHVRPLSNSLEKLLHSLATILTAHQQYIARRREQEKSAMNQCAKHLQIEISPWNKNEESYIFFMIRFLQSQSLITDVRVKYLRLERAMSQNKQAKQILSFFSNSRDYRKALFELNSTLARKRSCFSDAIKPFEKLPNLIKSNQHMQELHLAIRGLRSHLHTFFPLNEYISDNFVLRCIFYRLTDRDQEKLMKKKKKYDTRMQENTMRRGLPKPPESSWVFWIIHIWNVEEVMFGRDKMCLVESARQDTVSGSTLTRAQITGSNVSENNGSKKTNSNSISTEHQQKPKRGGGGGRGGRGGTRGSRGGGGRGGAANNSNSGNSNGEANVNTTSTRGQRGRGRGGRGRGAGKNKPPSKTEGGPKTQKKTKKTGKNVSNNGCAICKNSECSAPSGVLCKSATAARRSKNKAAKQEVVDKLLNCRICPCCGYSLKKDGGKHTCPETLKITNPKGGGSASLDISKVKCPSGCERNGIPLPLYLCPCGRQKQTFKKKSANITRIIQLNDLSTDEDEYASSGRDAQEGSCVHWEENVEQTDVDGQPLTLCISHDTCADYSLMDPASFERMVDKKSMKPSQFTLQTASSKTDIESREGVARLHLANGEIFNLEVLECPAQGARNILNKRTLARVTVPEEVGHLVDLKSRQQQADAHVLLGQNSRRLFPRDFLWENQDRTAALRRSPVSNKGILEGKWEKQLSEMQVNVVKTTKCFATDIFKEKTEELEDSPALLNVVTRKNKKPTKILPVPLGASVSNQGYLKNIIAARQFPKTDDPLILPPNHAYWLPRLVYDPQVPGDRATCYLQSKSGKIPSILKTHPEDRGGNGGKLKRPPGPDPSLARVNEDQENGCLTQQEVDELTIDKKVKFSDINIIEIPYNQEIADVVLGSKKLETLAEMKYRKKVYKQVKEKLEHRVAMETGGHKRLQILKNLKQLAYDKPTDPLYQRYRGHLSRAVARQVQLNDLNLKNSRNDGARTFLLPENDSETELLASGLAKSTANLPQTRQDYELDENSILSFSQVREAIKATIGDIDFVDQGYNTWYKNQMPRRHDAPHSQNVEFEEHGTFSFTTKSNANGNYLKNRTPIQPFEKQGGNETGFDLNQSWPQPKYPSEGDHLWIKDWGGEGGRVKSTPLEKNGVC